MGRAGHPDALALLQDVMAGGPDFLIRTTAILGMGYGWREHPGTLPLLRDRAMNDPDSSVRLYALKIIVGDITTMRTGSGTLSGLSGTTLFGSNLSQMKSIFSRCLMISLASLAPTSTNYPHIC
jgi:hypothetical protein